jgi:biotin carboxyl carrier protein
MAPIAPMNADSVANKAPMTPRPAFVRVRPGLARPDDPVHEMTAEGSRDRPERQDPDATAVRLLPQPTNSAIALVEVVVDGWRFELEVEDTVQAALREKASRHADEVGARGPVEVRAIIPGRVVSVDVAEGDRVEANGHLLVLEAMKMQNELRAPAAGRIARIAVTAGRTVDRGDLLLVIDPAAEQARS